MSFKDKCNEFVSILKKNAFLADEVILSAYEKKKIPTLPKKSRVALSVGDVKKSSYLGGGERLEYSLVMRVYMRAGACESDCEQIFFEICKALSQCPDVISVSREHTAWDSNVETMVFTAKAEIDEVVQE